MPHDYKGRPLAVGNLVLMLAVLTAVNEGDACNFTATVVDPKAPLPYPPAPPADLENQTYLPTVTANGKLLDLVDAIDLEQAASFAYDEYSAAVGGVAFNGDPLPSWEEFSKDPKKEKQANAWRAVGKLVELSCKKQIHLTDAEQSAPAPAEEKPVPAAPEPVRDVLGLELAWGLIANAGGGDWQKTQTPEWQEAAAKWRDRYVSGLYRRTGEGQGFTSAKNADSLAATGKETIKLGATAGAFLPVQPVTTSTGVVQDPSGRTQSADVASVPATPAPVESGFDEPTDRPSEETKAEFDAAAAEQKEGN